MLSEKALEDIRTAIEGLEYPSESDEPFEIVENVVFDEKPQKVSADVFFEDLRDSEDWLKFAHLKEVLEMHLSELSVFRVKKVRVDVYVVGRDEQRQWSGVKTVSVET